MLAVSNKANTPSPRRMSTNMPSKRSAKPASEGTARIVSLVDISTSSVCSFYADDRRIPAGIANVYADELARSGGSDNRDPVIGLVVTPRDAVTGWGFGKTVA